MTPAGSDALIGDFRVYTVLMSGSLFQWYSIVNFLGIRPVTNIRSDVLISQGDGTVENPFILNLA